jgi:hypothetical protein
MRSVLSGEIFLMNEKIKEPWIKLKSSLCHEDYDLINLLLMQCIHDDQITLKLELDYKLSDALNSTDKTGIGDINELTSFRRLKPKVFGVGFQLLTSPL